MRNPLKRAWRSFSTWRHGRGFGVHSPLAYYLLTETLHEPRRSGYYAYRELGNLGGNHRRRRLARIVFRLVARFTPRRVAVVGDPPSVRYWASVVGLASRRTVTGPWGSVSDPEMVIVGRSDPSFTPPSPGRERIDFFLDTSDLEHLVAPLRDQNRTPLPASVHDRLGPLVIDSGRGYALAVSRRGLTPITIKARF